MTKLIPYAEAAKEAEGKLPEDILELLKKNQYLHPTLIKSLEDPSWDGLKWKNTEITTKGVIYFLLVNSIPLSVFLKNPGDTIALQAASAGILVYDDEGLKELELILTVHKDYSGEDIFWYEFDDNIIEGAMVVNF